MAISEHGILEDRYVKLVQHVLKSEEYFRLESVKGLKAYCEEPVYLPDGTKLDSSKIRDVNDYAKSLQLDGIHLNQPDDGRFYLSYAEPLMLGSYLMTVDFDEANRVIGVHFPG